MAFTHLHVHSEYSLLDGACRVKDLVARAKALGQDCVAITDHGVMYGAVTFYKEAKAAGIKPIIGCEVYLAARSRLDMEYERDSVRHHLILLCKNETGYKNLCMLVSRAFTEGFYVKPRVDMELLREYSDGLIAMSACLSGKIPRLILEGRYDDACAHAIEMREIFGEGNFYLELQRHGLADERVVNDGLVRIHDETGIPLVATNDAHYLTRDDAYVQDVLMCMQTGKTVDDPDRLRFDTTDLYFKSESEMRELFTDYPEACDNTVLIAQKCEFDFSFGKYHLPEFTLPEGENAPGYLKALCLKGLARRYGEDDEKARAQLDYELEMIDSMGFTDYFLIVSDFISYAKSVGIPVGPGRGSAAGSIASYCLDITTVDPLKYGLYFERFLNPERVSMPDIDIDFCERRRSEVIDYVKRKYGEDRVAQIVTFNTLKAKNAVRNVAKTLSLTFAEESALAKEIPGVINIEIKDALKASRGLATMYETDERVKRVIDTAMALEGMPKDSGTHAAGVVITKRPVREYVPLTLSKKDDSIATQYTMTTLEELGLLKMDFLGLRNLTVIDDAVKDIHRTNPDFSLDNLPEYDKETFDMLSAGKTLGVFQMESAGMTGVCVGLLPKSIEDLTAIIALYRPGPMESIPRFLENSKHPEKITYRHPLLQPILDVTYGCIVYQEQVIEIFRRLGGFSLGQADMIRRAMSKKKQSEIEREKLTFIEGDIKRDIAGAIKNGVPRDVASAIYDEILDFANYAFNKAHAVAYAVISYQTAYLKRHYPRQYMAALLSSVLDYPEKVSEYAAEALELGIKLLPPDVNESGDMFTVAGDDIRYGLVAVKNIGRGFILGLIDEREQNGRFTDFEQFVRRMGTRDLNRRALESLIKCGGFDSFGVRRSQLMMVCETVLAAVGNEARRNVEGQLDLFGASGGNESAHARIVYPNVPDYTPTEKMEMEHEVTGLYLSGHPMDEYRETARKRGAVKIAGILDDYALENGNEKYADGQTVTLAGVVTHIRTRTTKNNTLMSYVTLDDGTGTIELLAFQRTIDEYGSYMRENAAVIAVGKLSARDEKAPQVMLDRLTPIDGDDLPEPEYNSDRETSYAPARATRVNTVQKLYLRVKSDSDPKYEHVRLVLSMFPGKTPLVLYFEDTKKKLGGGCLVRDELLCELRETLGEDNVVAKRDVGA